MKIALVGNQNSGKTSLFNLLTGTNQKIGNWPGVTIERKEGKIKDTDYTLIDLPGVYSLSPYTTEEEITRSYVVNEKPDLIINIVDATSLERSLYLTTQLLELDCNVVIALNMIDLLESKGIKIDETILSNELNTTIVKISALKNTNIDKLIEVIKTNSVKPNIKKKIYCQEIEDAIESVSTNFESNKRFLAVKLLERDHKYQKVYNKTVDTSGIEAKYGCDIEEIIANQRYEYIDRIKSKFVTINRPKESMTDVLDKVFLNKYAALPIFFVLMFCIYFLVVGIIGSFTVDLVAGLFESLAGAVGDGLTNLGASDWSVSLICDGIIAGVGAVLGFVPQLIILFICISILETTGYMSRIAFFFDRLFKYFGLSGKSLIPFIVGSGCSVPAIMATRTIEDDSERKITIMTTPFIPCSAKLPIIALFFGYFFDAYAGLFTFLLYILAIVVILVSSWIMSKFIYKSEGGTYISELPEYKVPSLKYVGRDVFEKSFAFIKRAGSIILLCSIVVWFLLSFNFDFWNGMVEVEESMLAKIGNCLAWIFYPMTGEWSWAASVSAIQGLVAKEQVVSGMNIIAGLAAENENYSSLFASDSIFGFFNGASATAFAVFCLFSAPCIGAIGAMKRELGSFKKTLKAMAFQTGLAWVLACITFLIGSLIMLI